MISERRRVDGSRGEKAADEGGIGATLKQGAQVGSSTAYTRVLLHMWVLPVV